MIQYFSFIFFTFFAFATQHFSTPVTSSNHRYLRSSAFYRASQNASNQRHIK